MTKVLLTAAALSLTPFAAFAMCAGHSADDIVMSCAEGSVFDADTQKCVPETTS